MPLRSLGHRHGFGHGIEAPDPRSIIRITEPSVDPVSLKEVKAFARIDGTAQDPLVASLIKMATRAAEDFCERAFITQVWRITFDAIPFDFFTIPDVPRLIEIPRPRLISFDEIKFNLEDGTSTITAVTPADFFIDSNSEPGRIDLKPGKSWPTGLQDINAIEIKYTAGYGPTASDVPDGIKAGIKQLVSTAFYQRESFVIGESVSQIPQGMLAGTAENYFTPYKNWTL